MKNSIIGKVTATEKNPSSCTNVRFWVGDDIIVKPFDIVKISHIKSSISYAVIKDLQFITDSSGHLSDYVSSDFGDLNAIPQNRKIGTTIAEAEILYNDYEIDMPIRDGSKVEWADEKGVKLALGLDKFENPIPSGYMRFSNGLEVPIDLEAKYLLGPEGAHLNIAGISGLATKTSYAMFLLNAIQQRTKDEASIIIFNVKGQDLLAIDEEIDSLSNENKLDWKKCGLKPEPFKDVLYAYPYSKDENKLYAQSHIDKDRLKNQLTKKKAFQYFFDVEAGKQKLDLLFSDIDDPAFTIESITQKLMDEDVETWEALRDIVKRRITTGQKDQSIPVVSWRKFDRLFQSRINNDMFSGKLTEKNIRHQILLEDILKELTPGKVIVIDIEPLPSYLQCMVVGNVIQSIYEIKLGELGIEPDSIGKVVIFADELNKYAPKSTQKTVALTKSLLEITERGRSLGVVLFGAEQFRSGIHERVLGNCSTNIFGRTSPVEINKSPDYKYFPQTYKSTISRLPQGELLIQHAVFKTDLIKVRFPFPCYFQPK